MIRQFAKNLPAVPLFCYLEGRCVDWFFLRYEKKASSERQEIYQERKGADSASGFRFVPSGKINSRFVQKV